MATQTTVAIQTDVAVPENAQAYGLAELVVVTGDQQLTSALRAAASRITGEAEREAGSLREQARHRRAEAAQAFAAVCRMVAKAEEDVHLAKMAAEEVSDETLHEHLEKIARQEEVRLREGVEWLESAQERVEAASQEARALELQAEVVEMNVTSRPEVVAWRQLTEPFLERIENAKKARAVGEILQNAQRQGLADDRLKQAAASRTRQLGELAWHTRETVKLWARYAPRGDGMYPCVTLPQTSVLAAAGPGTIFELRSDGWKVAIHMSEDGFAWVRQKASGHFKPRGALVRRIDGRTAPLQADAC